MKSEVLFHTWQPLKTLDFPSGGNWGNVFHFRFLFSFAALLIDSDLISPHHWKLLMITQKSAITFSYFGHQSQRKIHNIHLLNTSDVTNEIYQSEISLSFLYIFDVWHYLYNRRPFMIAYVCYLFTTLWRYAMVDFTYLHRWEFKIVPSEG
jgi:hypothetical protein